MRVPCWSPLACALLAACGFDAPYGTGYKCVDDGDCPEGQRCEDNSCQLAAAMPDDGGAPLDGASAGDAFGPDAALENLIRDPGFEIGGDDNWAKFNSTLERTSVDPYADTWSGRACEINDTESYTLFQVFDEHPPVGTTYRLSAWVRDAGQAVTSRIALREYDGVDWVDHDGVEVLLGGDWVELSLEASTEGADIDDVQLIVWGLAGGGSCFEIDQVAAYRLGS